MPEVTEYEFTPEETAVLAEFETAIREIQSQQQGALRIIAKQQKLEGQLDLVGNKLVRRQEPQAELVQK